MRERISREQIIFEHRFWLQVLGDHARFILNELSPEEGEEIKGARHFIEVFDSLLMEARKNLSDEAIAELTKKVNYYAREIRAFKLDLLRQHLVGNIKLGLSPTFINHMLNELDEYIKILAAIDKEQSPSSHTVHYHLLWLLDGSGHASAVLGGLDEVEKKLRSKAKEFDKEFRNLYLKTIEISGYRRTEIGRFPALTKLDHDAEELMKMFMVFLGELLDLRLNKETLGAMLPLMIDHMLREECYYLTKLSFVSDIKKPECNPGRPRLEE